MKIYCSGIGGIGLSAYAMLQKRGGHEVFGSDRTDSALLEQLRKDGIGIGLVQDGSAMPEGIELFVYSEAIPKDAPERKLAAERGIRSMSYFEALGEYAKGMRQIAVCGSHGKSTTTAMAARVLLHAGADPSVVVGTKVQELDGRNFHKGSGDIFLVEACEYRCQGFNFLSPSIVLMTSVDGDHFDAFTSVREYQDAFVAFLKKLPPDGVVITHGNDAECRRVVKESGKRMIDADDFPLISLQTPGLHMRENAQLVLALADHLGMDMKATITSLEGFAGTWRRMENRGELPGGITVVDDYGHHPREIRATLNAMREAYGDRRIVCVFQPHTHDRTIKLYTEFTQAFEEADVLLLPNVYDARHDIETDTVDLRQFAADIASASGTEAMVCDGLGDAEKKTKELLLPGDVLLIMGAGDIGDLADRIVR